jgi:lysophospholipase L1-like esterase
MRQTLPPRCARVFPLVLVGLVCVMAGCAGPGNLASQRAAATPIHVGSGANSPSGTTYVALGASDAYGIGTDDADRLNWPSVLAGELGAPVHLVNLAIPGATVGDALRVELPVALDVHPTLVTVWLAVNDLARGIDLTTYSQQLTALVQALRRGTQARVYVGNLPDLTLLPYFASDDPVALRAKIQQWNVAIATICTQAGAHLVDLAADWSDLINHPEYISEDGLHPSTRGAARIADAFAAAILATGAP